MIHPLNAPSLKLIAIITAALMLAISAGAPQTPQQEEATRLALHDAQLADLHGMPERVARVESALDLIIKLEVAMIGLLISCGVYIVKGMLKLRTAQHRAANYLHTMELRLIKEEEMFDTVRHLKCLQEPPQPCLDKEESRA